MAEPTMPDDPAAIAKRYATVAKKTVTDGAKVVTDAFEKINADPPPAQRYNSGDAIKTFADLANVALTGSISLARVALQSQADRGPMLVADNVASIVSRGLSDAMGVASEIAGGMNEAMNNTTTYPSDKLVDATVKLTNIGSLRGAEIMETIVAGPGVYGNPIVRRTFSIPADPANDRFLDLTSLRLTGHTEDLKAFAGFEPADGKVPAGHTSFTVVVNMAGLPSGMHQVTVDVWPATADPSDPKGPQIPDRTSAKDSMTFLAALPDTGDPGEP